MQINRNKTQSVLTTGIVALAAASIETSESFAALKPKAPGETKVVAIMGGDYGHNSIPLEMHVREIFSSKKNWRILFVRASEFFTPDLISDADLLITSRHSRPDDIGWRTDGIVESMEKGALLWTDTNANAIVDNVRNRGMGFLALHNTIACNNNRIVDLLDIEPIPHNQVQPLWIRDLNQGHPITRGIGNFFVPLDEQFAVVLKSDKATILFESTAIHDKRNAVGGWCLQQGNGRIVGLLPGHTKELYQIREYQEIFWRAAHWAMKREIPPFNQKY